MPKQFKTGRHACFTAFFAAGASATECVNAYRCFRTILDDDNDVDYVVMQIEKCPKTNKLHVQGYIHWGKCCKDGWLNQRWVRQLKQRPMHMEVPIKGAKFQKKYCWKDDTCFEEDLRYEKGTPPAGQGKRSDIDATLKFCKAIAHKPNAELRTFREHGSTMVKYPKGIQRYLSLESKSARRSAGYRQPLILTFWGGTGTGKSRHADYAAEQKYGVHGIFRKTADNWWSTYDNERCVIVEEFNGTWCRPTDFLQMLDGYPVEGQIKGCYKTLWVARWYITSNSSPDDWWSEARAKKPEWDGWAAIRRRLTQGDSTITHFSELVAPAPGTDSLGTLDDWSPAITVSDDDEPVITANQEGCIEVNELSSDDEMIMDSPVRSAYEILMPETPRKPKRKPLEFNQTMCLDDPIEDTDTEVTNTETC